MDKFGITIHFDDKEFLKLNRWSAWLDRERTPDFDKILQFNPHEFTIEERGWHCKLSYNTVKEMDWRREGHEGHYQLWVNGVLA